jgi:hypothetical protein
MLLNFICFCPAELTGKGCPRFIVFIPGYSLLFKANATMPKISKGIVKAIVIYG